MHTDTYIYKYIYMYAYIYIIHTHAYRHIIKKYTNKNTYDTYAYVHTKLYIQT